MENDIRKMISLDTADIDVILSLLERKIEKVEKKELDEISLQYLKNLQSIKNDILAQVSN